MTRGSDEETALAVQRKRAAGESDALERGATGSNGAPASVGEALRGPASGLDRATRDLFEPRFGDLGDVRIHTGAQAASSAQDVAARAYTVGRDVVFGHGQFAPGTTEGKELLAHELTHVAQQASGRARAPGISDPGHPAEVEADRVAAAVTRGDPTPPVQRRGDGAVVHRQPDKKKAYGQTPAGVEPEFWEWWKKVIGYEGDLDAWLAQPANANDRGGKTKYGVTIATFMKMAKGVLGVEPTEENFEKMTPQQAMSIGHVMWKSSGADRMKNTGVGVVLADWYWGGINLARFSKLLEAKGRAATFDEGKPDKATIAFMNTLPPGELAELMSDAKAEQYRATAKEDPTQAGFLGGWLKRNEERREQARALVPAAESADAVPKARDGLSQAWDRARALQKENPTKEEHAAQAEASAGVYESQRDVMVADARALKGMAASPGGTATTQYRDRYRQFAEMRDPWGDQLRAGLDVLKRDPETFKKAIARLEKLSAWYEGGGRAELAGVPAPDRKAQKE